MATASKTVTFRVTEAELSRLEERANDEGKTPGTWSKDAAFQKLDHQASVDDLRDRLISIEAAVEKMSHELKFSVDAILATLGLIKPEIGLTPEKVKEWREKKLKSP
jgi:hypothetical protein